MQHLNLAECLRHGCLQIAQTGLAVLLYRQTELCRLIFRIGDNLVCLCVCLCDNGRLADRLADVLLRLCTQVCRLLLAGGNDIVSLIDDILRHLDV